MAVSMWNVENWMKKKRNATQSAIINVKYRLTLKSYGGICVHA